MALNPNNEQSSLVQQDVIIRHHLYGHTSSATQIWTRFKTSKVYQLVLLTSNLLKGGNCKDLTSPLPYLVTATEPRARSLEHGHSHFVRSLADPPRLEQHALPTYSSHSFFPVQTSSNDVIVRCYTSSAVIVAPLTSSDIETWLDNLWSYHVRYLSGPWQQHCPWISWTRLKSDRWQGTSWRL